MKKVSRKFKELECGTTLVVKRVGFDLANKALVLISTNRLMSPAVIQGRSWRTSR